VNRALIDQYEADADLPAKAIAGLTPQEMNSFPIPGTWSVQQVILHLLDSDLVGSDRMKRVIAEPSPTLLAYDETAFVKNLGYERLDAALACEIFRLNRKLTAAILRDLPDAAFARKGNHTERGWETLAELVEGYVEHLHHHMKFVDQKLAKLGKA
jgi:hypothetical protein